MNSHHAEIKSGMVCLKAQSYCFTSRFCTLSRLHIVKIIASEIHATHQSQRRTRCEAFDSAMRRFKGNAIFM